MPTRRSEPQTDRGWAWIVLVACFFESTLVFGVLKSFGLLFVEFLKAFHTTASTISWVISVQTITFSVIAVFVLNIGLLYVQNRTFVVCGGFVASAAYIVSAFAENVEILFLSNGVMFGFSMSMIHGPALVILGQYFNKRRGLANSIANSGASIGGLIFPPMIRFTLDEYGLWGTLMIIAGLLLNLTVCGMLLRPLDHNALLNINEVKQPSEDPNDNTETEKTKMLIDHVTNENEDKNEKYPAITNHMAPGQNDRKLSKHLSYEILNADLEFRQRTFSTNSAITRRKAYQENHNKNKFKDALSTSSLALAGDMLGSIGNVFHCEKAKAEADDHESGTEKNCCRKLRETPVCKVFSKIIDYKLFKNKLFMVLVSSGLFGMFGSAMLLTYIPPHAEDLNIDEKQIALLVSIVSGLDITGRFITGIVADTGYIKRHNLISIAFMATGIVCHLTPFFKEFWSMAIFASIYGCFGGVYFSLFPVVIVDFAGLDKLGSGLAIMMLIHGTCISVTVPIIGAIRDSSGSYIGSFHMIGTCLIVAALILLLEPLARKYQNRSSETGNNKDDIT